MNGHGPETHRQAVEDFDPEIMSTSDEQSEGLLKSDRYMSSPAERSSRTCAGNVIFLLALFTASNLLLVGLMSYQLRINRDLPRNIQDQGPKAIPLGGRPRVDYAPEWLPPEEWRTEIFRKQEMYGAQPVGTAREAWLSLLPRNNGFVIIKNLTSLDGLPGLRHPEREGQHACVAVFHQLHCLYKTYAAYWDARKGKFEDGSLDRLIHCWDYLRQTIMCAGDTSLEWVSPHQSEPNSTDGWGFQHTCKNFEAIHEWAERHSSGG
ncbi:hypothetical protein CDD80_1914 [Ophiocordyceps camponoti-rufipedis]|uniref:Oxidase ustYa n=1 Tax=Ophiocordyceps camponoti-rufipedis TaxID=2004952 RepID=A0A2C5Z8C8_9HYPO|nr:hypothetical protein CDD80_1914 [Ophiocordyceps camponoti-rufipedis]